MSEGDGYYHFVARHSGKCVEVPGASTVDGVQLEQRTCNGTAAQSFQLAASPPSSHGASGITNNGSYNVVSKSWIERVKPVTSWERSLSRRRER